MRFSIIGAWLLLASVAGTQPAGSCEPGKPPGTSPAGTCLAQDPALSTPTGERSGFSHLISTENSSYNPDCNPWLTADETELFYIIWDGLNGPAKPGFQGDWDIYAAQWDAVNGVWGPGSNLGPNINTPAPERRPSTSATGDTLFFERAGFVYVSIRSGGQFGPITGLFQGSDPAIASDLSQIYFVRNRDIWVATRGTSIFQWTNLRSIGPPVNTTAAEVRPFLSADKTKLYFSDFGGPRPGGYGGGDIWVSTWTGSAWGGPVNMGAPINTDRVACSPYVNRDGSHFYTGSEAFEGSRGDEDIWVAHLNADPAPRDVSPAPGTWTKAGELPGAWNVYDLAVDRDATLYAATMPGAKVFRSADLGATWEPTGSLPGAMIAYSLLAASDGSIYAGTYPLGDVFRSTDRGDHWLVTANLAALTTVRALLETSDGRILAGTSPVCQIYATADQGTTWSQLGTPAGISNGVATLFEAADGALFAGGWGRPNRSIDGGLTWTAQSLPASFGTHVSSIESYLETEGGVIWCTGWVHANGGYVFRSVNSGATWDSTSRVMIGPVHAVRVYDVVEAEDHRLLIGYQPGPDLVACSSADEGQTWAAEGSLSGAHEILRFLKLQDGTILAATTPNGDVYRWTPEVSDAPPAEDGSSGTSTSPGVAVVLGGTPNPFRSSTRIRYQLPEAEHIHLSIVDAQGRLVRLLRHGTGLPGMNETDWDGTDTASHRVESGVYFVRLEAVNAATYQKVTLLR